MSLTLKLLCAVSLSGALYASNEQFDPNEKKSCDKSLEQKNIGIDLKKPTSSLENNEIEIAKLMRELLTIQTKILNITTVVSKAPPLEQATLNKIHGIVVKLHEDQKELIRILSEKKVL